jgi:hypothetical protein
MAEQNQDQGGWRQNLQGNRDQNDQQGQGSQGQLV